MRSKPLKPNPMNPIPELTPQLKLLRLSGILDSLDARNRQAIGAKLAYTDFLAMLVGDEVARRENKKFDMRLRRASSEPPRHSSSSTSLACPSSTARWCTTWPPGVTCTRGPGADGRAQRYRQEPSRAGLGSLRGAPGRGRRVHRLRGPHASLNAARATGVYDRKLAALARVPLLIIDDFGLKPLRAPADEDLHDLIAERYERTATIVTSNLDFDEWTEAFAVNRLLAAATIDRLRHNAYCLELDGLSYRDPQVPPTPKKTSPKLPVNAAK